MLALRNTNPFVSWLRCVLVCGCAALSSTGRAQVVDDFDIRFQAQQNGGIQFLANTTMFCGTGSSCLSAQSAMPFGWPADNNNGHDMQYYNGDNDPDTWCASSDSLSLGVCAKVSWAGLYWAGRLGNGTVPNENLRDQVKIKASDNEPYLDVLADQEWEFDASGVDNYCCFADVTAWVENNPVDARYTVANVVATQDYASWGGWVLVLVYEDALESMRNLTVFDGLAMITMGGGGNNSTVDVPISGFLTPPLGPVDLELGVVAYDGDRGESGDRLGFNGGSGFEYISDATHDESNAFNSTHSNDGAMTPWRMPAFNNTLGHDASVFVPDNSGYDFLPNNATEAEIRVTTGGESITVQVITSVIDVYEPDLRATVYIEDLNGGVAEPGDILEYTVVGKNLGSDVAVDVYATTTLDIRTSFVESSLEWVTPNAVVDMTDALGDDPGEFIEADQMVRVRMGSGANGTQGGQLDNDPLGMDSVAYRYRVALTDDCMLLQCDGTLTAEADIYGAGNISGNDQTNDGASALVDENGCPVEEVTVLEVQTGVCPPVSIEPTGATCIGDDVALEVPQFANNPLAQSLANYTWSGPNGFAMNGPTASIPGADFDDAGTYLMEVTFVGLECLLSSADYTLVVHEAVPNFDPPASQCLDDNAFDFVAGGAVYAGAAYNWTFESANPAQAPGLGITGIQFNAGGWQEVTLTLEEIGCTGTVTDSVFVETAPDLSTFDVSVYPASGCAPLTVLFSSEANPDEVAQGWTFSDGESSDADAPVHVFEAPGTYSVEVTAVSSGNCPASIDFAVDSLVVVHPNPPVGFMATPQIVDISNPVVTVESLVDSVNSVSYFGSDGGSLNAANGQYVFDNGGTFQLIQTVVSPEGCVSTALGEVIVNGTLFYAPTAFSPDGDGLNDVWLPVARGVSRYQASIWNRWGELVWSSQNAEEPWLGQSQSGTHFVPDGIYLWEVTYLDQIDYPHIKRGTLTLAR